MKTTSVEALAASFTAGETLFLPGATGEAAAFTAALAADPCHTAGLSIVTSFVPGINSLPLAALANDVRIHALFMQPGHSDAQHSGRLQHLPLSYAGFVQHLRDTAKFDATIIHVSPPNVEGRCSLGVAAEFNLLAAAKSRRRIGVINAQMPRLAKAPSVALEDLTAFCEVDCALRVYDPGVPDEASATIAASIAAIVPDGASVQLGLGKVPTALAARLRRHKRLRFWSGMISDDFLTLANAGALDEALHHTCCVAIGSADFYRELITLPNVTFLGCDITHNAAHLAELPYFVAVNSALEVDLFGQCNLEIAEGQMISGPGGAPDFAHAAARGRGLSIVALPATAARGTRSRVVPRLAGGLVSLPRQDVDIVATEFGLADLRGLTTAARAAALIAVAAPDRRENLARAWRDHLTPTERLAS